MTDVTTRSELLQSNSDVCSQLFDDWFDPIEAGLRERVRGFIEAMIEAELDAVLSRPRYGRLAKKGDDEGAAGKLAHTTTLEHLRQFRRDLRQGATPLRSEDPLEVRYQEFRTAS